MKVLILGASGIIGQHMRLCVPDSVTPIWHRRTADRLHVGCDLTDPAAREALLAEQRPDVIVNLAGESRPDVVEAADNLFGQINYCVPGRLMSWCRNNDGHLIHVGSQAVFTGDKPPYNATDRLSGPLVNAYGVQKREAEAQIAETGSCWTIARPTFVLGVRPFPGIGRENPLEQMLREPKQKQVANRWFSPSFASDVASQLWRLVLERPKGETVNIGVPVRQNRYEIACDVNTFAGGHREIMPVPHDSFPGLAPRPIDTTYDVDAMHGAEYENALATEIENASPLFRAARAISLWSSIGISEITKRLRRGFFGLHQDVRDDWNRVNPQTDAEILEWYRTTDAYVYELTAYHHDLGVPTPGWNYPGMCAGIAERLKAEKCQRVLCLGDGIGDVTLSLHAAGFDAYYHDLAGSKTADYAGFHFWAHTGQEMKCALTRGWEPTFADGFIQPFDAIVSLDFLEHVTDVPAWVRAVHDALRPDGLFCVQNAFAIGSGPDGSIPCHLARNDRFENDWRPMMERDFSFEVAGGGNWWRKKTWLNNSALDRLQNAQVRETVVR